MIVYFLSTILFILTVLANSVPQTPQNFALLTVTHQRSPNNQYFKLYLKRYAEMQCDIISQIAIVWNNDYQVQSSDLLSLKPKWKRPVYFHKTAYNSMSFRFQLPSQSKADVYYVIDDDIQISCEELKHGFKIWQNAAVGSLAPIAGYVPRCLNIDADKNIFSYYPGTNRYYSFILVGAAFISRQFLELFNSQLNFQSTSMVKYSQQVKNCDDLALNFLISKYYPYFTPIYLTPDIRSGFLLTDGPNAVSKSNSHIKVRNQCLKKYTDIVGMFPLTVNKMDYDDTKSQIWTIPKIVQQKIIEVAALAVRGQFLKQDKINSCSQALKSEMSKNVQLQTIVNKLIQKKSREDHIPQGTFYKLVLVSILSVCIVIMYTTIAINFWSGRKKNKRLH